MRKINKKASVQIPMTPADLIAIIAWIVVIVVFFILFQLQGCNAGYKREIKSSSGIINADTILMNYLRTPTILNQQEIIVADLIIWSINEYGDITYTRSTDEGGYITEGI